MRARVVARLLLAGAWLIGCGGRGVATDSGARQELAHLVVKTTGFEEATGAYHEVGRICGSDTSPIVLGRVGQVSVSPSALHAAVERDGGADIVTLADGSAVRLPGDGVTLQGARWSDDGERLAYFADGSPMLIGADGSEPVALDVALPSAGVAFGMQAAEWSSDGRLVAFATSGQGILADRAGDVRGTFSSTLVEIYGTPWLLSFSHDGRYLAGLQANEYEERTLVIVETETLAATTVPGIEHYMLAGWVSDDRAVALWDVAVKLWLVTPAGEARAFAATGVPSPTEPVLALGGPGLPIYDLRDDSTRTLLPESDIVQNLRFLPGGEAVGYQMGAPARAGYLALADGSALLDGWGLPSADGWVALPDPKDPNSGLVTRHLYEPDQRGARLDMKFPSELSASGDLVTTWRVSWLSDGRLAFLSDDGVHIAERDGSTNTVVCPVADWLAQPQRGRIDEY